MRDSGKEPPAQSAADVTWATYEAQRAELFKDVVEAAVDKSDEQAKLAERVKLHLLLTELAKLPQTDH
jgi:hypothetical protein